MKFILRKSELSELDIAFDILRSAAKTLYNKSIDQWYYWLDPPIEKINWVKKGFKNKEFFFIENESGDIMGMVRVSSEDLTYWGQMNEKANYVHSLIIKENYAGNKLGLEVLRYIEKETLKNNIHLIRLDCDSTNESLCAYYENKGFKKVGQKVLALGKYNLYEKQL